MPEKIALQYGGSELQLEKSEKLVAVRPQIGRSSEMLAAVAAHHGGPAGLKLGGFEVVSVERAAAPADETLDQLRAASPVQTASHVYHTSDDGTPFVPTGEIYVVFREDTPIARRRELLEQQGLERSEEREHGRAIVRVTPQSPNPIKAAAALQQAPEILCAEPELATTGKLLTAIPPLDPLLDQQWHLRNAGVNGSPSTFLEPGADARVVEAWEAAGTLGDPAAVVAVIDDGFDLDHPDLGRPGKVVAPRDFSTGTSRPTFSTAETEWHGTACSGVAVAAADGQGVVGAAPRARWMPVGWGPHLSDSQVEAWFDYVAEQGAWVVSCSWSAAARRFTLSTRIHHAIERCARFGRNGKGCVIVFAAGNETRDINDPGADSINGFAIHPDVIAVAASNSVDKRSSYSNFGDAIWLCAPSSGAGGKGVTTADVRGSYVENGVTRFAGYSPGLYTHDFGGTSSSTPLVAGVAALLLSVRPDLTSREVKELLARTARKIGDPADYGPDGRSRLYGHGCVNAAAAVRAALAEAAGPQATAAVS